MCRRMILLICFVAALGLANSASAVDVDWTNGDGDRSWCNEENWQDPDKEPCVPGPGDNAIIDTKPTLVDGPIIDGIDCDVNVGTITGPNPDAEKTQVMEITGGTVIIQDRWNWRDGEGTAIINISGNPNIFILGVGIDNNDLIWRGSDDAKSIINISGNPNIYVNGSLRGADNEGGWFEVNMSGGYLYCTDRIWFGDDGVVGILNLTGGTIITEDNFGMFGRETGGLFEVTIDGGALLSAAEEFSVPAEKGRATINLINGTIECGEFDPGDETFWTMDINDGGLLRIKGRDQFEEMEGYITEGKIIGRGGEVTPVVVMDGSDTVVAISFTSVRTSYPIPAYEAEDICPNDVELSWKPAIYADTHSIYFGPDMNDVNESADPCATLLDVNSWMVPYDLELDTTYYWRVDGVNDACDPWVWPGTIWRFTTENGQAYDENPPEGYRGGHPDDMDLLTWTPSCVALGHNVWFGTDLPERIPLLEDDFESGAFEPNWTNDGWEIWDANDDPCWADYGDYDHNLARAVGAGVKTLTSRDIDATHFCDAIRVRFNVRRSEDVNTGSQLKLQYYDGSSYNDIDDFNVVTECHTPNDWETYTHTVFATSRYLRSDFRIRLVADLSSGSTVWIDNVQVHNDWPVDPNWLEGYQAADDNDFAFTAKQWTHYYWRIDTITNPDIVDPNVIRGDFWDLKTGNSGSDLLMYYKFDGSLGGNLPSPITDDSSYNLQFTKYVKEGSVKYGESNPIVYGDDNRTSADFDPNAGLYRDDPCRYDPNGWDILRLDGTQYTIELWVKPEKLDDDMDDIYLIAKRNSWALQINDPGDDNEYRWTHAGNDEEMDEGSAVVGEWAHLAAVYDRYSSDDDERMKFYLNGVLEESAGEDDLNPADNNYPVTIGYGLVDDVNVGGFFVGLIDEIRIYDVALTPCEFLLYPGLEWARCPSPYDTEIDVDPCEAGFKLSWRSGIYADKHDIYFGTSLSAVDDGASPYVANHDSNSWTPPETLELGKPYFWRVDEKTDDPCDDSPWEGAVWRFTTMLPIDDPNLILWYKFDEAEGEMALDSSGYGNHGDVEFDEDDMNEPSWEPNDGHIDGCLEFDDDTRVDVPSPVLGPITDGITIAVWLQGRHYQSRHVDMTVLDASYEIAPHRMTVFVPDEDEDVYWRAGNDTNDVLVWNDATPKAWQGDWHHFGFVKDENAGTMKIYFDGIEVQAKTGTISSLSSLQYTPFRIGTVIGRSFDYEGRMDDFRIYDYALPAGKIEAIFRGGDLERAWGPYPYDGQPDAPITTDLSWRPGDYAASHDVYFGTDWGEVNDANSSIHPNVDHNNVTDTNYAVGPLELDETYYWRIDEVNDACDPNGWKGYVWRFKVADYIVIDDMEDYTEKWNSEYPITTTQHQNYGWDSAYNNGTGSLINLSCATCQYGQLYNGGDRAMYYWYDLTEDWGCGYYHAEISNHFDMEPNNWTTKGIMMLTLWFLGDPCNAASIEQMYVGLEDSSGSGSYSEVRYGDDEDEEVNDIAIAEWQQWNIPLDNFTSTNLESVETLYIGFGERGNMVAGGAGGVIFDDIRLYPPTCVLWKRPSEFAKFDIYPDCIVDFGDVGVMAEEWLKHDINVGEVTPPPDANLVGWWTFDEGSDSNAYDYSGNEFHGVIETIDSDVYWIAGRNDVNYALDFDGGRVLVPDTPELRPKHQVSVCAWINYYKGQNSARVVVKGGDNWETFGLEVDDYKVVFNVRDGNEYGDKDKDDYKKYTAASDEDELAPDDWIHIAGTFDGNTVTVYVNGEVVDVCDTNNAIWELSQDINDLAIGNRSDATNRPFKGIIDDVRVYDCGLSAEEVGYLASDGTGIVVMESIADLVGGEPPGERAVNFRDLAILGDNWLKESLYP